MFATFRGMSTTYTSNKQLDISLVSTNYAAFLLCCSKVKDCVVCTVDLI